jgi:hypothetical protein
MAKRRYTIFCDESSKKGRYFSNFYGGALVLTQDREGIEEALRSKKEELNRHQELKGSRVTENYLDKYTEFINFYFDYVETERIKVRVMFTQNMYRATKLTAEQLDLGYFLLYYQMIKHAFGIQYCNPNAFDRVYFELFLDEVPHSKIKFSVFRDKIASISETKNFEGRNIFIPREAIAQIDSKIHTILQGLDVILGAMHFRVNDLHLSKPEGSRKRGKRTIAKEKLYKVINKRVRGIYPNFNVGTSTGVVSWRRWKFSGGVVSG